MGVKSKLARGFPIGGLYKNNNLAELFVPPPRHGALPPGVQRHAARFRADELRQERGDLANAPDDFLFIFLSPSNLNLLFVVVLIRSVLPHAPTHKASLHSPMTPPLFFSPPPISLPCTPRAPVWTYPLTPSTGPTHPPLHPHTHPPSAWILLVPLGVPDWTPPQFPLPEGRPGVDVHAGGGQRGSRDRAPAQTLLRRASKESAK